MNADLNLPPGVSYEQVCGVPVTRMTMRSGALRRIEEDEPIVESEDELPLQSLSMEAFEPVFAEMRAWKARISAEAKAKGIL